MAAASLAPYCLFIYSRSGKLLFHREWRAQKSTESGPSQQAQLLFGVLTTLEGIGPRLAPKSRGKPEATTDVHYYRAGKYAVHHYRSGTGWRFALLTNEDAPDCSPLLRQLYCDVFVPLVIRNPLADSSEPIALPLFDHEVDQLLLRSGATLAPPRPTAAAAGGASSHV
ncbi:hypothetical protein FNF28_04257 [Cafeteria roenbergensis]|uniref:Trafficking protein particle complex subunit n=1 Tax=Cafeteria roenbergensis TaxID=33653 RepID=A0A5A8DFF5_CAFRO|nr:hypothetical protein FNF28_04257 [Cafeteria roenbergensis]